ncbi:protein PFC0760c-like isoform X1 [Vespa mandarinia]|uniref:protein PFC0760c-like isoform X1 n=1 Tax=Vespa mandarinia TaxID=7446 RepID=UPI00161C7825|nr:protein PFC0760c-like isoform X1 [Vespa mandarinia]XP_035719553.1 protein PFC0760c-like isoform X1 [Vespa mandarinia]XP_035719554.1 protein PFC0760c-like isoform X1 [Vespa mandarinia]
MEEEKVSINNNSNCSVLSSPNIFNKVYESLNKKYETSQTKLICNNQKRKRSKPYFSDNLDNTKYLWEDIRRKNIKCNTEERSTDLTDSNCIKDTNTNVPLRVLIKQMLDEAFGKPSATNVNEDRVDLQNTNDNKINSEQSSLTLEKEDNIELKNETNNSSIINSRINLSNETCLDRVKCIDNKLISIEEEAVNFSSDYNVTEYTGMYLSRILKFSGKSTERIKNNDIVLLQDDKNNSTDNAKVNKDFLSSSVLPDIDENEEKECDDSLHCMNLMKTKLPINQEINIENKFAMLESIINSTSNLNFDSSEEKTTDFFNISNKENNVKKKETFYKGLNLLQKEDTKEIFLSSDNSIDIDQSTKNKSKFTSKITINLQKSCKKQRQSITVFRIKLHNKRTPKLSMKTNNKSIRTVTPRNNVVLAKEQIKYANISPTSVTSRQKTTKGPKIQQNRVFLFSSAKVFKSREINKNKQMLIPQLTFTPASPENRD